MSQEVAALYHAGQLAENKARHLTCLLFSMMCVAVFMFPMDASASSMAQAICKVVSITQSQVGRGVASLAVIVLGMGAMLGKASWTLALTVATGIVILFGAQAVSSMVGAGGAC